MIQPDTTTRYGTISRLAHTLGAIAVLVMLGVGLYFHEMPRGDERSYWLGMHVGLGVLLFLPLMFRVGWSVLAKRPDEIQMSRGEQLLAATVHRLLLAAIVVMLVSGVLIPWSGGHDIEVFSWFVLPTPMGEHEGFHEGLELIHGVGARGVLVLTIVHVIGVIKQAARDFVSLKGRMFL